MAAALYMVLMVLFLLIVPWMTAGARRGLPEGAEPEGSDRERRLWLLALTVLLAIYATIGPGQAVAEFLRARNLLRLAMAVVLLPVAAFVLRRWIRQRPGAAEVGMALGVAGAYLIVGMRIHSWEERTHLIEYGVLGLLIYLALAERFRPDRRILRPAVLAVTATALLGWLDEGLQALVPDRVYDLRDVAFNALAGLMAVGAHLALGWARRRFRRRNRRPA